MALVIVAFTVVLFVLVDWRGRRRLEARGPADAARTVHAS